MDHLSGRNILLKSDYNIDMVTLSIKLTIAVTIFLLFSSRSLDF